MAEVAHILPAEVLGNPPDPVLAKGAEDYAAEIGTTKRTIYRWLDLGRQKKDMPPLDEPGLMLAWWSRNMKNQAPANLTEWVTRKKVPVAGIGLGSSPASSAGVGAPPAQPDRPSIDMQKLGGHGLEAAVHTLRQNVEAISQLLGDALNDPNDQKLELYQRRFEGAVDQLRKAEASLISLQKARGDLAPRSEFRSDLHTLLAGLRGMMRRRADNVCNALVGHLTADQLGLVRAAIVANGALDEQHLRTARAWHVSATGELQLPAA
jgi:hypothetical protein